LSKARDLIAGPRPLWQVNLFVTDLAATERFYAGLGWTLVQMGLGAATADLPGGLSVAFLPAGDRAFVAAFDSAHPGGTGGTAILDVRLEDREQVDKLYRELLNRGGSAGQAPIDAFWGSRYAVVVDPDGTRIGLKSPVDDWLRSLPPDCHDAEDGGR
jgi:catechol 2,3-dioxygenase-like lactoylglutathione lyase family enzyme